MKKLTKSNEDYLEAIYILELQGGPIKSVMIAKMLDVSKPAVSKAMNELCENGLINLNYYSDLSLTEKGRETAKAVYHKHTTIKAFLLAVGVSPDIAEIDCCKIEHVISDETLSCFDSFLKNKH